MIAEAFGAKCTCNIAHAGEIPPCPLHGYHPPSSPKSDKSKRQTYVATWGAGYMAGFAAALKAIEEGAL